MQQSAFGTIFIFKLKNICSRIPSPDWDRNQRSMFHKYWQSRQSTTPKCIQLPNRYQAPHTIAQLPPHNLSLTSDPDTILYHCNPSKTISIKQEMWDPKPLLYAAHRGWHWFPRARNFLPVQQPDWHDGVHLVLGWVKSPSRSVSCRQIPQLNESISWACLNIAPNSQTPRSYRKPQDSVLETSPLNVVHWNPDGAVPVMILLYHWCRVPKYFLDDLQLRLVHPFSSSFSQFFQLLGNWWS